MIPDAAQLVVTDTAYPADDAMVEAILYRLEPAPTVSPAVLVMHGGPTTRALLLSEDYLCRALARAGFVVLAGHYRSDTGFSAIDDADAIAGIDFLIATDGVDPERIGMAGHSRGGFVAQRIAGREPRLKSIVSMGSGTDMTDVDERNKPYSYSHYVDLFCKGGGTPEGNKRRRGTKGPSVKDLEAIDVPILWVHGSRDLNAPPESAIQAYDIVRRHNDGARLDLVDGMDHFWGHPTGPLHGRVASKIADWFTETI